EVPNADFMLAHTALWDVIYEHYSYFGQHSLSRLFSDQGFRILRLDTTFGGQFLCLDAAPGPDAAPDQRRPTHPPSSAMTDAAKRFGHNSRALLAEWRGRLDEIKKAGRRAVVWGAGSKGVTFLNLLSRDGPIEFVVDINPRKQGMAIAGTGQTIIPPVFLVDYRPDIILVMNRNYAEEIADMVREMGLEPEFWFV
ncbi:MAG TPA: methyltransferase, partial [Caldilineae bacterium]|nr:methyltransferase [Caldilineae bacterium]